MFETNKIGALYTGSLVEDKKTEERLLSKIPDMIEQIPKPVKKQGKRKMSRNQTQDLQQPKTEPVTVEMTDQEKHLNKLSKT